MTYKVKFVGRKLNASGVIYEATDATKANPTTHPEECRIELSRRWEHIMNIRLDDSEQTTNV